MTNFSRAALAVHGLAGGPLIIARGSANTDVMSLDNAGNLRIAGHLFAAGTTVGIPGNPLAIHRTPFGTVGTYGAQQTLPTIEDFGQARLTNGAAFVRVNPAFAAIMDQRSGYLVFMTPRGDANTLYVAQATPRGFVVRESKGGHATLTFDYRIVAKPADASGQRLPPMTMR